MRRFPRTHISAIQITGTTPGGKFNVRVAHESDEPRGGQIRTFYYSDIATQDQLDEHAHLVTN